MSEEEDIATPVDAEPAGSTTVPKGTYIILQPDKRFAVFDGQKFLQRDVTREALTAQLISEHVKQALTQLTPVISKQAADRLTAIYAYIGVGDVEVTWAQAVAAALEYEQTYKQVEPAQ